MHGESLVSILAAAAGHRTGVAGVDRMGEENLSSRPIYGFYPEHIKQAKSAIHDIARVLLTGRPDAEFLRPGLITRLTSELNDFLKHHQQDASEGWASPKARDEYLTQALAKMEKWKAQP
jgi:hypothetical protein